MKDKIISGMVGALVGGCIVFGYTHFYIGNKSENLGPNFMGPGSFSTDSTQRPNRNRFTNSGSLVNSGATMTGRVLRERPTNAE